MQYAVKKGDTLAEIAVRFGTTVNSIMKSNAQIKDPNQITPDQVITVPTPSGGRNYVRYTVRRNDTLTKIAQKHGISVRSILAVNPQITNPNLIYSDQVIRIPVSEEPGVQPGVPGEKPLRFLSATLQNGTNLQGATQVPLNPIITLNFDKNVIDNSLWENNKKSITLSQNNNKVAINITRSEDFSLRQKIFVQPVNPLQPNTTYTLKISPDFRALNNEILGAATGGQGVSITFKTAGNASS